MTRREGPVTSVLDVGQYIYDKLGKIDPWRLQKLTYYAESWSLAWDGESLFPEGFQAWADGPVSHDLHREDKWNRNGLAIDGADVGRLTERQRTVIDHVLSFYGSMSRGELIERTHREAPWVEARGDLPEGAPSRRPIDRALMRKTYASMCQMDPWEVPLAPPPAATDWDGIGADQFEAELSRWQHTFDWLEVR